MRLSLFERRVTVETATSRLLLFCMSRKTSSPPRAIIFYGYRKRSRNRARIKIEGFDIEGSRLVLLTYDVIMSVYLSTMLSRINSKRLIYIVPLSLWALLQFTWGNKFFVLFIVVIFLLLVINRPPRFMLVAGLVLAIALFATPTIATLQGLQQSNLHTVQNLESSLTNVIIPNSGKEALPKKVQHMLFLLQTHHVASYRLSNRLEQDMEVVQRITESAWPIKMESTSPNLLIFIDEIKNYSSCTEIGQNKEVALVYCP